MTIPRRLTFRILAACLGSQARRLKSFSARRSAGRRGREAIDGALAKAPGRREQADELLDQAEEIAGWIGDPCRYQGPGIDVAVVGYLAALCFGAIEVVPQLKRLVPEIGGEPPWKDIPAMLQRIMREAK